MTTITNRSNNMGTVNWKDAPKDAAAYSVDDEGVLNWWKISGLFSIVYKWGSEGWELFKKDMGKDEINAFSKTLKGLPNLNDKVDWKQAPEWTVSWGRTHTGDRIWMRADGAYSYMDQIPKDPQIIRSQITKIADIFYGD